MFKNLDTKQKTILGVVIAAIVFVIWYFYKKNKSTITFKFENDYGFDDESLASGCGSSSYSGGIQDSEINTIIKNPLPSFYNLRLMIDVKGKKNVFPITLVKQTDGQIELPNRRSLLEQSAKYRFIDVNKGEKINVVALINLSYTVDHFAFNDDFLLTDKDYLIAYTQAEKHFGIVK